MNLLEKLTHELNQALKSGNRTVVSTLRILLSELKNKKIELGKELEESQIVEIISQEAKKRKEAIEQYQQGHRAELAQKETEELAVLTQYLPKELSDQELIEMVIKTIAETSANSAADMGKVMAALMPKVKGRADGARVSQMVKEKLA